MDREIVSPAALLAAARRAASLDGDSPSRQRLALAWAQAAPEAEALLRECLAARALLGAAEAAAPPWPGSEPERPTEAQARLASDRGLTLSEDGRAVLQWREGGATYDGAQRWEGCWAPTGIAVADYVAALAAVAAHRAWREGVLAPVEAARAAAMEPARAALRRAERAAYEAMSAWGDAHPGADE